MNVINKYKKEYRFIIVGGTSTLIDFIIYILLSLKFDIILSKCISMTIASIFSFFLNKNWTFLDKEKINIFMIIKYFISQLINIGVNTTINALVYNLTNIKIFAFFVATFVAMCINFLLQKAIVFKESEK